MKLLELFAGSRSVGKEAEKLGWSVLSSDIKQYGGIDYVVDILDFDILSPAIPDVIWASPDCTTYSIAGCSTHRKYIDGKPTPITEKAKQADRVLIKLIEIINYYLKRNPDLKFFIENPRGLMRKMLCMQGFSRHTVTYCQYGDTRMKLTDIWTNCTTWKPRPMCKNGDSCHVAAPRGAKTGTQGLKGSYDRSRIPAKLCEEILLSIKE